MSSVSLDFPTVKHQPQRPSTIAPRGPKRPQVSRRIFFFREFPVVPSNVDLDSLFPKSPSRPLKKRRELHQRLFKSSKIGDFFFFKVLDLRGQGF